MKLYYKKTPTLARPLTEQDYEARGGIIETIEGPAPFQAGDYLGRDRKGFFPIKKATLETYVKLLDLPGTWAYYQALDTREATKQVGAFSLGGQHGKAGDYTVRNHKGREWIVDGQLFESDYAEEPECYPVSNLAEILMDGSTASVSITVQVQEQVVILTANVFRGSAETHTLVIGEPGRVPHYRRDTLSTRQIEAILGKLTPQLLVWRRVV